MSRQLLKNKRVISQAQFKSMTKMERMYFHLLFPDVFDLTDHESHYLKRLKTTFHIISNELSTVEQRRMIDKAIPEAGDRWRITGMINDAMDLFGDMLQVNKQFLRAVLRERYVQVAKKAEAEGDWDTARLCYRNIADIEGLHIHDAQKLDMSLVELPEIIITSNPAILEEAAEYEEIDE